MVFNWAFIGTGKIAKKVAREIEKTSRHKVVSCYSRNASTLQEFAQEFKCRAYNTLEECIQDEQVQGVYIATPHGSHYSILLKAIELKKPILCEKAFCMNQEQAKVVFEKAKQFDTYVCEAMWMKFNPIIMYVNKAIKNFELGDVTSIEADFSYNAYISHAPKRVLSPEAGGGALYDIGIYTITFAHMLLGMPVDMQTRSILTKDKVDVQTSMFFVYPNNTSATLICSLARFTRCMAKIKCTRGEIIFPLIFHKPRKIVIKDYSNKTKKIIKEKIGYIYEFDIVADEMLQGLKESHVVPFKDTLEIQQIMDQIRVADYIQYPVSIMKV